MNQQENSSRQPQPEDPRVRFAGERTLLAWVRTGLAMMGFGFVVARFGIFLGQLAAAGDVRPPVSAGVSLWIGTALVALGVFVNVAAAVENHRFTQRLNRGEPFQPPRWSLGLLVSLTLAAVGVGMVIYLLVVGR